MDFSLIDNFLSNPLDSISQLALSIIKNETRTLCNNVLTFLKVLEINFEKLKNIQYVD